MYNKDTIEIREWTHEIQDWLMQIHGQTFLDMCKELLSINTDSEKYPDRSTTKQAIDNACKPYGLIYDEFKEGGFATRDRWILEAGDTQYYLQWNTWWNYFMLYVSNKKLKISLYTYYINKPLVDTIE